MILDSIFTFYNNIFISIINSLPNISFTFPQSVYSAISNIFGFVGFFFPVTALIPLIVFNLSLNLAIISWALIIRIKSFIPTMGA